MQPPRPKPTKQQAPRHRCPPLPNLAGHCCCKGSILKHWLEGEMRGPERRKFTSHSGGNRGEEKTYESNWKPGRARLARRKRLRWTTGSSWISVNCASASVRYILAVLMLFHLPTKQTRERSLVARKKWVAPPRRSEYHWYPSGNFKSLRRLLRRERIIPGETLRK